MFVACQSYNEKYEGSVMQYYWSMYVAPSDEIILQQTFIYYCERRIAKRRGLAVESFIPQLHGAVKHRDILETLDFFFYIAQETKRSFFLTI